MPKPFKVAVVQDSPAFLDLSGPTDKCVRLIEEVATNGAILIAFPETFLPGHPWFISLDSPAWGLRSSSATTRAR